MNTKAVLIFAVAIIAFLFVPSVPSTPAITESLVALPEEFTALILALVTAGLMWLLAKVSMGQYTQALAAVIAPMVIAVIERLLGAIPPVFDNLVISVLHLIVLFVSGLGVFLFTRRVRSPLPAQLLT